MKLSSSEITHFNDQIWDFFAIHRRNMPWREKPTPYYVLVSELMLQQTQVQRVVPKFKSFIDTFPDISSLAMAPLSSVLQQWSGLGYNRRAKFLHQSAQRIVQSGGVMPLSYEEFIELPGVGPNTAGAIMCYAYNQPIVFVETNIRTVFLHHFFNDTVEKVDDTTIRNVVEQTIDREQPREWYWALMDYGTHLKKTAGGRLEQSNVYKKQSPLSGSIREMRGRIIKNLTSNPTTDSELREAVKADDRFDTAITALQNEGFITMSQSKWCLTGQELHS